MLLKLRKQKEVMTGSKDKGSWLGFNSPKQMTEELNAFYSRFDHHNFTDSYL